MVWPQGSFPDFERTKIKGFGLSVIANAVVGEAQIVKVVSYNRMPWPKLAFSYCHGALDQGLGFGV